MQRSRRVRAPSCLPTTRSTRPRRPRCPTQEAPSKFALKPKTPWKPVARPASIDPNCGGRDNPCPLQRWMRFNMAPALAAKNAAALAAALDRSAGFAPGGNGDWQNIAKTAAAAARAGDIEEARKSCRACHGAFKAMWREKYRLTPIN